MSTTKWRSVQISSVLLCSALVLSGCSGGGGSSQQSDLLDAGNSSEEHPPPSEFTGETPDFSGPWAEEFTLEYQRAESDFVRTVLADEVITDQELSETRDKFTECMEAYGFTNISFDADGGFEFYPGEGADDEAVDDQVHECSEMSGESSIGALHSWIRRNPDNQDEATIMAACLVRKKVVEPSYSAEHYADDAPEEDFPFFDGIAGQVAFHECNADPLGLFENE